LQPIAKYAGLQDCRIAGFVVSRYWIGTKSSENHVNAYLPMIAAVAVETLAGNFLIIIEHRCVICIYVLQKKNTPVCLIENIHTHAHMYI
jgi:hypothetical protein